jgi:hypothetical protein
MRKLWPTLIQVSLVVSCIGENHTGRSTDPLERTEPGFDKPASDAGLKQESGRDGAVVDAAAWSLGQCYTFRDDALRERREEIAGLEQCDADADCGRTFSLTHAECWGPSCGPLTMLGSAEFEAQVRQLYEGERTARACETLHENGCEFPPPSCPIGDVEQDSPSASCVSGACVEGE